MTDSIDLPAGPDSLFTARLEAWLRAWKAYEATHGRDIAADPEDKIAREAFASFRHLMDTPAADLGELASKAQAARIVTRDGAEVPAGTDLEALFDDIERLACGGFAAVLAAYDRAAKFQEGLAEIKAPDDAQQRARDVRWHAYEQLLAAPVATGAELTEKVRRIVRELEGHNPEGGQSVEMNRTEFKALVEGIEALGAE